MNIYKGKIHVRKAYCIRNIVVGQGYPAFLVGKEYPAEHMGSCEMQVLDSELKKKDGSGRKSHRFSKKQFAIHFKDHGELKDGDKLIDPYGTDSGYQWRVTFKNNTTIYRVL